MTQTTRQVGGIKLNLESGEYYRAGRSIVADDSGDYDIVIRDLRDRSEVERIVAPSREHADTFVDEFNTHQDFRVW